MITSGHKNGFTIVELLIVIVVIAILAAISIVAYNGIQNRTHDTAVQADLRQLGSAVQQYYVINNAFPAPNASELGTLGIKVSRDSYGNHYIYQDNTYNLLYCRNDSTGEFAYVATSKSGKIYHYRDGGVKEYSGPLTGSVATCTANGVSSPTTYWYHGHGATSAWVSWS